MRIVIALGGNALGNNPIEQKQNTDLLAKSVTNLIKQGHQIIFTHGNGPQVGLINLAFEEAKKVNSKVCDMPFSECGAMSQGYIGYHLQNSLLNEFKNCGIEKSVVSLITQVLVDKNDLAFKDPSKPIGSFYSKEEAAKLPYSTKEDSNRGYRRVIASPKPIAVIEKDQIVTLLNSGFIVISCGGGGIPVINDNNKLIGIDAVIDKDLSSAKLASDINADILLILTAVENACINFGKPNEVKLENVTKNLIDSYLNNNEFAPGSMKPKIQACLNFLDNNKKAVAIITSIENATENNPESTATISLVI